MLLPLPCPVSADAEQCIRVRWPIHSSSINSVRPDDRCACPASKFCVSGLLGLCRLLQHALCTALCQHVECPAVQEDEQDEPERTSEVAT